MYIQDNFVFRISDLEEFENLEEFTFSGHLDEEDKNINTFPKMDKLRVLDYSVDYPLLNKVIQSLKILNILKNLKKLLWMLVTTQGETKKVDFV